MSNWKQLVSASIVGSGSQAKLPELSPLGVDGLPTTLSNEERLLTTAIVLSLRRRAGCQLHKITVPEVEPAEPETQPQVLRNASAYLAQLLSGAHAAALPEWLRTAALLGKITAPEQLPALLEYGAKHRDVATLLPAVIGKRGAWLVERKPAWKHFDPEITRDAWETGTAKQRAAWLQKQRLQIPETARIELEAVFPKEPADTRSEFLSCLAVGLSISDEPFLENVLDDKSKEVRKVAAKLLHRLPESRFAARMAERASRYLTFHAGGLLKSAKIEVTLPEELDAAMKRDAVDPAPYVSRKQFGERAAILMLVLGGVDPAYWEQASKKSPEAILKLAKDHEWEHALISGWAMAATAYRNAEWAAAILQTTPEWSKLTISLAEMAAVLAPEQRVEFMVKALRGCRVDTANPSKQMELLLQAMSPMFRAYSVLPEKVVDEIFLALRALFLTADPPWTALSFLQEIAPRLPASTCPVWVAMLNEVPEENRLQRELLKTADFLQFRIEMLRALHESDL